MNSHALSRYRRIKQVNHRFANNAYIFSSREIGGEMIDWAQFIGYYSNINHSSDMQFLGYFSFFLLCFSLLLKRWCICLFMGISKEICSPLIGPYNIKRMELAVKTINYELQYNEMMSSFFSGGRKPLEQDDKHKSTSSKQFGNPSCRTLFFSLHSSQCISPQCLECTLCYCDNHIVIRWSSLVRSTQIKLSSKNQHFFIDFFP